MFEEARDYGQCGNCLKWSYDRLKYPAGNDDEGKPKYNYICRECSKKNAERRQELEATQEAHEREYERRRKLMLEGTPGDRSPLCKKCNVRMSTTAMKYHKANNHGFRKCAVCKGRVLRYDISDGRFCSGNCLKKVASKCYVCLENDADKYGKCNQCNTALVDTFKRQWKLRSQSWELGRSQRRVYGKYKREDDKQGG